MKPSAEIRDLVLKLYAAMKEGNVALLDEIVSKQDGVVFIGSDPREWWMSHATITEAFKMQSEQMGGGFPIVPGEPHAYAAGGIGWSADSSKFEFPDGGELPFRATYVFQQEEDGWKMVQGHFSVGLDNEETVGQDLAV